MTKRIGVFGPGIILALWHFVAPASVFGQGNAWAGASLVQMVESARWRIGNLRVNAALELTNTGYDTDIYYGYLPEAVPDGTIFAALPIQVFLPLSKTLTLELYDSPQYAFYLKTVNERGWNNTFRGLAHFSFKQVYIQAGAELANVRRRVSSELNVNAREITDRLTSTMLWQASREISLAMLFDGTRFDYVDGSYGGTSLSENLNRTESYVDLISYLQPSPKVRLFLDGQYGWYVFQQEASSYKDSRSYSLYGGFEFITIQSEPRSIEPPRGSLTIGYKRIDLLDPALLDGSGFVGNVDVSTGLLARTTGRLFFSRDFTFSAYSNATYYLSTTFGTGLSVRLSRRATVSYELSLSNGVYPDVGADGLSAVRNYRYQTHIFRVNVQLARDLTLELLGQLNQRIVGDPGVPRNRNFFGINLVYGSRPGTISAPVGGLSR